MIRGPFYVVLLTFFLGLYVSCNFVFTSISNSVALPNLYIEVTDNNKSDIFSSLSRDFDQTLNNMNENNENSTQATSES